MGPNLTRRIIVVSLCLSVFILPWWLTVSLIVGIFFIFPTFYEGLFLGLIMDLTYFVERSSFPHLPVVFLGLLVVFSLAEVFRRQLRIKI